MEIQVTVEEDGHLITFVEGDVSNTIFLNKKNRYKLQQLLIEEQLKEI